MKKLITGLFLTVIIVFSGAISYAQSSFTFTCDRPAMVGYLDSLYEFSAPLVNTGDEADTFSIILTRNHPENWVTTLCVDFMCFPDSIDWTVDAGDTSFVTPHIDAMGYMGGGWITIRVRSHNNPSDEKSLDFYFTTGYRDDVVDVVLVDGDPNGDFEEYYTSVFDSVGMVYDIWPRWFAPLTAEDIQFFGGVVWFTGNAVNTLTTEDFDVLASFLDDEGDLFISGQGIAADLQDSSFLQDYLHASYVENTDLRQVDGIDGDMISDGMSFFIEDGGGADNQTFPSSIVPANGSTPTLTYSDGSVAGIKYSNGVYQMVFFSFGFEAISDVQDRLNLVNKIGDFLQITEGVDDNSDNNLPERTGLLSNYPNPFNAMTTITYMLERPSAVELDIYNIMGQKVATLVSGNVEAGSHTVIWDAGNYSSGIYFYKLNAGNKVFTNRMTLLK